ncbi:hypothetical protein Q8A67_008584 [Cirrhinus molitorella]|uniref:Ig-like domain-containing protein n=1 Tax=Cirrhinus molitorella TaxID=172907 RepID=A0AA88TPN6_9TELE|nr:hypothetical protein Q8A67_008584 [Cirrhinus molitorella]
MAAYTTTKILYIPVGFWLILGVECDFGWSNHMLTVQTGGSVTIPCHYDKKYIQQKKYWHLQTDTFHTYTNTTQGNLSVIDHPDQSLFTVTMRNLQNTQTGHYYCVVGTDGQSAVVYKLYLKVQSVPDVSVVSSSVSGHEGGDISVECLYSSEYQNKLKQWCRYKDQSCYTVGRTDTSQNSLVQITDDGRKSFTVLMTGLRLTDSGWYCCFVGEAAIPVQLTVIEAKPDAEKDTNNELLTVWLSVLASLLLLLLVLNGVFTWRLRWRPNQDKHQIRDRDGSRTTDMMIYSTINDEHPNVIRYYSTIDHVPGSEAVNPPAVQWKNLQISDSGYYWCAVEIVSKIDAGYYLYLTVQSVPDVSVASSSVSGHEGGDISVQCFYRSGYKDKPKQWCRFKDKGCYNVGRTYTFQNPSVQISEDDGRRSFTVLMTGLRLTDSGWYFCSVGDRQVPVQLTVTKPKREFTTIPAATPSDSETDIEETNLFLTVNSEIHSKDEQNKSDVILATYLVLALTLLMLVTLVAIVWRLKKKPERGQIREEEHFNSTRNASFASADDCSVIYSSVITFHKAPSSSVNSEAEVIYSSVKQTSKAEMKSCVNNLVHPSQTRTKSKVRQTPDVSVVHSSVSGHEGGNISVQCLYSSGYQKKVKQWCRYKDKSCYTVGRTDTSQNSSVQITDDDERRSFTVLMTGLRLTDSGWYFCSVGDRQVPVQLTVTAPTTILAATPSDFETDMHTTQSSANMNTSTMTTESRPETNMHDVILVVFLPVMLALLLIITIVAIMPCENQMTSNSPADATSSASVDDCSVIYSSVITFHKAPSSSVNSEGDVIYSAVKQTPKAVNSLDVTSAAFEVIRK